MTFTIGKTDLPRTHAALMEIRDQVGWSEIGPRYEWASSQFRDTGGTVDFEYLDTYVGADTAYTVAIERCSVHHVTQPAPVPHELRATMIFRLEDNEWKITHRHADPLSPRSSPSGP